MTVTGVSIRAPAWGATRYQEMVNLLVEVSIRAPAWGATGLRGVVGVVADVSIRAPAWGATPAPCLPRHPRRFQFALPHGERRPGRWSAWIPDRFNSRSRMGSDLRRRPAADRRVGFNSRSRMGSDNPPPTYDFDEPVSIRAPAWGATQPVIIADAWHGVSIRAPAWGATKRCGPRPRRVYVSIRAPAWGATAIMQWQVQPA